MSVVEFHEPAPYKPRSSPITNTGGGSEPNVKGAKGVNTANVVKPMSHQTSSYASNSHSANEKSPLANQDKETNISRKRPRSWEQPNNNNSKNNAHEFEKLKAEVHNLGARAMTPRQRKRVEEARLESLGIAPIKVKIPFRVREGMRKKQLQREAHQMAGEREVGGVTVASSGSLSVMPRRGHGPSKSGGKTDQTKRWRPRPNSVEATGVQRIKDINVKKR